MMSSRAQRMFTAIKVLGVFVITVALTILVVNAMRNPVDVSTTDYSADFTDASGLHTNGDVRYKGMRVGKVTAVKLDGNDGDHTPKARVSFTLDKSFKLTNATTLAIKYQNLTGVRYLDFRPGDNALPRVSHLGVSRTVPSFDITELFNGLQPVFSTMDTAEVNAFSENAIALLQGDGSGLEPMLESTQKLANFAQDRQLLISTVTRNIARIADSMGGRSGNVIAFLQSVDIPIRAAMTVLDEFQRSASFGPVLWSPLQRLVNALGFSEDLDVDQFIKNHFASMTEAWRSFQMIPNTLAGLPSVRTNQAVNTRCSKGRATLPPDVRLLINGNEVVLCNR